nr:MAG TPA: hypothetical protein [Caudoviricetes sp.]
MSLGKNQILSVPLESIHRLRGLFRPLPCFFLFHPSVPPLPCFSCADKLADNTASLIVPRTDNQSSCSPQLELFNSYPEKISGNTSPSTSIRILESICKIWMFTRSTSSESILI